MQKCIYIKGKRYYLYEVFDTTEESRKEIRKLCKYYRRKCKSRWFVLKTERGFWFPEEVYALYLTNVCRLWG